LGADGWHDFGSARRGAVRIGGERLLCQRRRITLSEVFQSVLTVARQVKQLKEVGSCRGTRLGKMVPNEPVASTSPHRKVSIMC